MAEELGVVGAFFAVQELGSEGALHLGLQKFTFRL